jgi:hypothetical protein
MDDTGRISKTENQFLFTSPQAAFDFIQKSGEVGEHAGVIAVRTTLNETGLGRAIQPVSRIESFVEPKIFEIEIGGKKISLGGDEIVGRTLNEWVVQPNTKIYMTGENIGTYHPRSLKEYQVYWAQTEEARDLGLRMPDNSQVRAMNLIALKETFRDLLSPKLVKQIKVITGQTPDIGEGSLISFRRDPIYFKPTKGVKDIDVINRDVNDITDVLSAKVKGSKSEIDADNKLTQLVDDEVNKFRREIGEDNFNKIATSPDFERTYYINLDKILKGSIKPYTPSVTTPLTQKAEITGVTTPTIEELITEIEGVTTPITETIPVTTPSKRISITRTTPITIPKVTPITTTRTTPVTTPITTPETTPISTPTLTPTIPTTVPITPTLTTVTKITTIPIPITTTIPIPVPVPKPQPKPPTTIILKKVQGMVKKGDTQGLVAWKQGWIYKVLFPPYSQTDILNTRKPVEGIEYHKGLRSAYDSIVRRGGYIPTIINREMGIYKVQISTMKDQRKPELRFRRDIEHTYKGKKKKISKMPRTRIVKF